MTGLRIATHLSEPVDRLLAAHVSAPQILPYTRDGAPPWQIPPDADVLITFAQGWRSAPAQPPAGWPFGLRYIQIAAAGVDAFPAWFFIGPSVSCGRGITAAPIAEWTIGAMLAHEKRWGETRLSSPADWKQLPLGSLQGKTVGLLGAGAIGREIAHRAAAFGMKVIALRRSAAAPPADIELVGTLAQLMAGSDHLVVCAPLTPQTHHLLNAEAFAAARPGLHLVNVSRGLIVDDDALLAAIAAGRIAAASLDVTAPEPLPAGHPFYACPQIRLTPHISWSSDDGDARIANKLLDNLERHLRGEPLLDLVDAARGY
jgi:phosphoglycerate dehydrogenase-like enzyme